MFAVLFEVEPKPGQWDTYLGQAKALRPELEKIDGFIDNVRYRSLTRDGLLLSLSGWRDEKALVRWRTHAGHHVAQEKGRGSILRDYHLRIGEIVRDTNLPSDRSLPVQRLDETQAGEATAVVLIDGKRAADWVATAGAQQVAQSLGLQSGAAGLTSWDVFDAVLTPGDVILMLSWRDRVAAETFESAIRLQPETRLRRVRIVRDYGMFDRREAPQYYPEVRKSD
ncbi:MAG TPA: antibiotic biosynthesis monooxygenase [Pseudolabrys sp.]|nr:antibiotic biosynthesis monooxygenase [Pseudolabrys sp.]